MSVYNLVPISEVDVELIHWITENFKPVVVLDENNRGSESDQHTLPSLEPLH